MHFFWLLPAPAERLSLVVTLHYSTTSCPTYIFASGSTNRSNNSLSKNDCWFTITTAVTAATVTAATVAATATTTGWLTQGIVIKDRQQGPISRNYWPITSLSTTWTLVSGILADKLEFTWMNTCIRLREALAVEAGNRSTNSWSTNQLPRMPEVYIPTWLWDGLTTIKPTIQCLTCGYRNA